MNDNKSDEYKTAEFFVKLLPVYLFFAIIINVVLFAIYWGSGGTAKIFLLIFLAVSIIVPVKKCVGFGSAIMTDDAKEKGTALGVKTKHIYGLNMPKNSDCTIRFANDGVIASGLGETVKFRYQSILGIEVKDETSLMQKDGINIGGAIIGGLAFGSFGAALGGMKPKNVKVHNYYLVIVFKEKDLTKYAMFDVTSDSFAVKESIKSISNKLGTRNIREI